jgi:hypothetical protein
MCDAFAQLAFVSAPMIPTRISFWVPIPFCIVIFLLTDVARGRFPRRLGLFSAPSCRIWRATSGLGRAYSASRAGTRVHRRDKCATVGGGI